MEKKPDWAGLETLLTTGDYAAAAASADEIAAAVKPKRRAPDFLPRSIDVIRALMRRGVAQLRLGELDPADEAFAEAYRVFKDREFQRLLSLEARQATAAVAAQMFLLERNGIELMDMRSMVILHRMHAANLAGLEGEGASGAPVSQPYDDVTRWLGELKILKRIAAEGRESLAERFEKGSPQALASPYSRALVGKFRPAMIAGITSLELSGMPVEVLESDAVREALGPISKLPEAGTGSAIRAALLKDSLEHFQAAAVALDEVFSAVSPTGALGLKSDSRIEAALTEAELLIHRGAALKEAGELARARKDFARVLELQREVSVLRKIPKPDSHPDLLWPLLLDADAALAEARQHLAGGDNDQAQSAVHEVAKTLARAADLPCPEKHPLRGYLAILVSRLQRQRAALEESLPRSDATDAAARRVRGAIDATALPGIAP